MKGKLLAISITAIALLLLPAVVLAADITGTTYRGQLTITNNSTAANNTAGIFTLSTPSLIDGSMIATNASDGAILNTSLVDSVFMPGANATLPWCLFVPSIGDYSSINNYLYTGNVTGGKLRYFPGDTGLAVSDDASLEIGDNGTVTVSGFVDTDNGTDKYIVDKADALRVYVSPFISGNITADINSPFFTDNFSADAWTDTGAGFGVNTGNSRIEYNCIRGNGDDTTFYDFTAISDTEWTLDYTWNPTTQPVVDGNTFVWGLWEDDANFDGYGDDAVLALLQDSPLHVHLVYWDEGVQTTTTDNLSLTLGTTYYVTLARNSSTNTTLSLYSDQARTAHISGSPITQTIASTVVSLRYIQASNFAGGGLTGRDTGWIDSLTLNNDDAVFISASGVSSAEHVITTSISDTPDFDTWASDASIAVNMGAGMIPALLLEEQVLSAPTASVTFSDIDDLIAVYESATGLTARHLILNVNARSEVAQDHTQVQIKFNGDSGNRYNQQYLRGINAADAAGVDTAISSFYRFHTPADNYGVNVFGGGSILIPHAFNTTNHKTLLAVSGAVETTVITATGRWADTSAINEILIKPAGGIDWAIASTFQLAVVDERYLVEEANITVADNATFTGLGSDGGNDYVAIGYVRSDRAATSDGLIFELNGDAVVTNYFRQRLAGTGAATSAISQNKNTIGIIAGNTADANAFASFIVAIPNYTGGNQTSTLSLSGYHGTGAASGVEVHSDRWNNTAVPNQLALAPEVGTDFVAGSLVSLYRVPRHVIARVVLDTALPEVLFKDIPQGYSGLQLNIYARSDRASDRDNIDVEFNGDITAANYDTQYLQGAGAAVSASRSATNQAWLYSSADSAGANEFGISIMFIPEYSSTDRHKHSYIITGVVEDRIRLLSCRWESLSAITQIGLTPTNGTIFLTNSVFELIGYMPKRVFMIQVDGEVKAITDATADNTTLSMPDNANDWVIAENGAMPYVAYTEVTDNDTQVGYWDWEYGLTFTDSSGYGNTATPSFRTASSDSDVVITLDTLTSYDLLEAPPLAAEGVFTIVTETPTEPGGDMFEELNPTFLGAGLMTDLSTDADIPIDLVVFSYAFGLSILVGLIAFGLTRTVSNPKGSLFIQAVASLMIMIYFTVSGGGVIPPWVILPFALEAVAIMMFSQSFNPWG